jgi:hydroxyacylglutathione hydrolase
MNVIPVPCLKDNYAYLIEGEGGAALVVDPSEAAPVREALAKAGLRLGAILCTHHHWDHVGGVQELAADAPRAPVVALDVEAPKIKGVTRELKDGEPFELSGVRLRALHIPGHTLGAVAFVLVEGGRDRAVFTGDTLFVAGCGRLFEGTPADMNRSLGKVLGALADDVSVYCGHEYTESNLRFAAHVEPGNAAIAAKATRAKETRAAGAPTVPSTMADERATNPFLRVAEPPVRAFTGLPGTASTDEVFAFVRKAKDDFR